MIDDFNYYANESYDTLSNLGYKLDLSAHRYYCIELYDSTTITYDRLQVDDEIVGRIYSDGSTTKIHYGVATDVDILNEEKEFIKL
ncbi:hypothetical protein [Flammeovirga pacifica]|uniref:Uncharacterized protein n=1 Tax=Flammeovirga pacifica TaxID=915059 RepID=A0A1S1Z075_FLAPC|nr:hypothetical protein [Flammeovirga pacifica]OHX66660.1 hypothetical protein NH26_09960 [Flammeovirga pacifica]